MRRRRAPGASPRGPSAQPGSAGPTIPSAATWLPLLGARLGIRTKHHQQALLVALMAALLGLWFLTPLSDYAASLILWTVPIDSDVALGKEALLSLEIKYPRVADRWGVQRIGMELVKASRHSAQRNALFDNVRQCEWDFAVVHAPFVNAFALPGGIVRVTDALLRHLRLTDAELAALIGHEMGHVLNRHTQKRSIKNRLLSTLWEAFVYEDHDGYDESFGEAVGEILWDGASHLGDLAFSRADEYQADDAAWEILASTYDGANARRYHPGSVRRLLQKLWEYQGGTGSTSWEGTHPGTRDRISALKKRWESLSVAERRRFVGG